MKHYMIKGEKHLFWIWSDFHYLICQNIIHYYGIKVENCLFVCWRNLEIDNNSQKCHLYDQEYQHFLPRIRYYLRNRSLIKSFFRDNDVFAYYPFSFAFPQDSYFKRLTFYEEGFSAYRRLFNFDCEQKPSRVNKIVRGFILSLFNKNVRGYLNGFSFTSPSPMDETTLICCTEESYRYLNLPRLNKIVLPIVYKPAVNYCIPAGSTFLVLDRFVPYSSIKTPGTNKRVTREMLDYCKRMNIKEVWTKLHPADFQNSSAEDDLKECLNGYDIKVHMFDGKLEFLALQNIGISFIGTHSTILYYAPILGNRNTSISFSRYLYSIEPSYEGYLKIFGGLDGFIDVFSKQVECI